MSKKQVKRLKREPQPVCEHCGGSVRIIESMWIPRGTSFVECKQGCWACECGEMHGKNEPCAAHPSVPPSWIGEIEPLSDALINDEIPF